MVIDAVVVVGSVVGGGEGGGGEEGVETVAFEATAAVAAVICKRKADCINDYRKRKAVNELLT